MKFNNTVGDKKESIGENDVKIDVTASTPEEKAQQDKILNEITEINDFNDNSDETPLDESEDDDDSEEEESESEEDESEEEAESEEDNEESDEGESEESDEEDSEEESDDDQPEAVDDNVDWTDGVKQKQVFDKLFKDEASILPKSARENYQKFYDTGNEAFLHIDNSLHKLIKSLEMINPSVPFPDRVKAAFKLAFSEKSKKMAQKKGEVIAEVRTQKVGKSASAVTKGEDGKSSKTVYSKEQTAFAKRIGVELPK